MSRSQNITIGVDFWLFAMAAIWFVISVCSWCFGLQPHRIEVCGGAIYTSNTLYDVEMVFVPSEGANADECE